MPDRRAPSKSAREVASRSERRIRSGTAPHAVTFRDRVGRLRQFLIASGQIQMAASARIRRKIEQPEESGMFT